MCDHRVYCLHNRPSFFSDDMVSSTRAKYIAAILLVVYVFASMYWTYMKANRILPFLHRIDDAFTAVHQARRNKFLNWLLVRFF